MIGLLRYLSDVYSARYWGSHTLCFGIQYDRKLFRDNFAAHIVCVNLYQTQLASNPTDLEADDHIRTAARAAFDGHPPTVRLTKLLHNGEPEPAATGDRAARAVEAKKRLKYLLAVFGRYPRAGIDDVHIGPS